MEFSRILVRATNWVGDAVMSLPALQAIRRRFPGAHIAVLARPWVADIYRREKFADQVIPFNAVKGVRALNGKWRIAAQLRAGNFDCAILLQNALEAALIAWLARIPKRIGYDRDARGLFLTDAIDVPMAGEIRAHESYYYLEMLRRAGLIGEVPEIDVIRLEGAAEAAEAGRERLSAARLENGVLGISPGAAFGNAKRWYPERFAGVAVRVARESGLSVALFGSASEVKLCKSVERGISAEGVAVKNFAGQTSLAQFIELAAACRLFLTNDSGAMHISSALGVPTVAVFGPTDHAGTAPTGDHSRIVREPVDCAPCKLRECPIDHRCMKRVTAGRVADVALELLK